MKKSVYRGWFQSIIAVLLSVTLFVAGCSGAGTEPAAASTAAPATDAKAYKGDGVDYTRAMAKRSQSSENSDPRIVKSGSEREPSRKSWTVMIYMIGSNLESRLGNATKDLEEIDAADLNFEDFNVVAYTGGSARWVGDVPCSQNSVLDMSLEGDERIVASTKGNANMGLPETLSAFLTFCDENYPAEHNALILWDHGAGPLWGYGSDELYDGDSLMLTEMRSAMDASPFAGGDGGRKLDLVGFDACLMASLESMTIWSDYADYYVGSEELEPGDGWNYEFLKALEDSSEVGGLTESILSRFEEYYAGKKSTTYNPDLTLSCVDLSRVDEVNAAIDALGERMIDGYESGKYAEMVRDRSDSKSFGMGQNSEGEVSFYYDLVDIVDLAEHMKDLYTEESAVLIEKVQSAVEGLYANVDGASGMTLYYPFKNKGQFSEMNAYYAELKKKGGYTRYLSGTGDEWLRSKSRDWNLGEPVDSGDEYTLQLTEDQIANMSGASYSILLKSEVGYVPYMENCKLSPDKEGVLHLNKNMQVAVIRNGSDTRLIRTKEVESDRKRAVYVTQGIRFGIDYGVSESADVTIKFMKNKKSGEVEIQDIALDESVSGISAGKTSIDIADWEHMASLVGRDFFIPARDGTGRLRPFREWIRNMNVSESFFPVENEVGIELADTSESQAKYAYQIQIEDINGEIYGSELVPAAGSGRETSEIDTENGTMQFILYEDHAELSDYSGRDQIITVPETVSGLPVTCIQSDVFEPPYVSGSTIREITLPDSITEVREDAFKNCNELEKIHFPAGLKTIGNRAFYGCISLKEAELPDSVERIGKEAFQYCDALTEFRIPKGLKKLGTGTFMGCTRLEAFAGGPDSATASGDTPVLNEDGAIYTADGSVLLAYPKTAAGSFTVKEGTKKIAYGAFEGAPLDEVIFPDSLTEIGNYAFYECNSLKAPVFHEGLKKISVHAFGAAPLPKESIPAEAEVIRIPASVETIAAHAFDNFVNVRFEVSEDNRHYTAEGGSLMNKAGDTLYKLAIYPDGTAMYPEGIITFDEEHLSPLDRLGEDSIFHGVRNIYLPASMTKFPDEIEDPRHKGKFAIYHCPSGSEAEKYAIRLGLNYTNEKDGPIGSTQIETPKGTLYFDLYENHAVLIGYSGEDEVLEIPAQAEGRDVTAINSDALSEAGYRTEVILPSTIRYLRRDAMSSLVRVRGTLENLEILETGSIGDMGGAPLVVTPSLRYIDPLCGDITSFEQNGENENYLVKDGVLFSADGTELVMYPGAGADEEYSVPEGTVSIGKNAFRSSQNLKSVSIPASLKVIGENAFSYCSQLSKITFDPETELEEIKMAAFADCKSLTEISLPAVKEIGIMAFDKCEELRTVHFSEGTRSIRQMAFYDTKVSAPEFPESLVRIGDSAFEDGTGGAIREGSAQVIRIPAKVTEIGVKSFASIGNTAFEVDPESPAFSAVDGILMDKDKNEVIACPSCKQGRVVIPDGATCIDSYAFSGAFMITDVEIPDSVMFIGRANFELLLEKDENGEETQEYSVTIHCSKGSYAEKYAERMGIPCEAE